MRGFRTQHLRGLSVLFYLCCILFIVIVVLNIHVIREVIFFLCAAIFSLLLALLCSVLAIRNAKSG